MHPTPYIADAAAVADAAALIERHGPAAAEQAGLLADRSRGIGNLLHFCRWRQIERLIAVLAQDAAGGTLH